MNTRLSARDRKVLTIGVAVCTLLVVSTRGVPALARWTRTARANAEELSAEAARATKSVAGGATIRDSLASARARYLGLGPRFLEGETTAGAGSALASIVSTAAAAANVRMGSAQIHADTGKAGAFSRVSVRANLTGDIRGIVTMLAALERGQTLLAVRELSITQPDPAAGDDRAEVLRADLVVESLARNPRRASSQ